MFNPNIIFKRSETIPRRWIGGWNYDYDQILGEFNGLIPYNIKKAKTFLEIMQSEVDMIVSTSDEFVNQSGQTVSWLYIDFKDDADETKFLMIVEGRRSAWND